MAVVSVKELHQKRRSSIRDGKVSHTRVWLVITDDIRDGTAAALTANANFVDMVPVYGAPLYDDNPFGPRVTSLEAQPIQESGLHFEVQAEYTIPDPSDDQNDTNPLDRPAEIQWSPSETTEPYFVDESDPPRPVVNAAGEPFEQFLEREAGELTITITRNEETFNAAVADTFSHTVNAAAVTIDGTEFAPGTLKLSPIQAQKVSEKWHYLGLDRPIVYYKVTYNLKARHQGWTHDVLNVGFNERVQVQETENGQPVTRYKLRPLVDATGLPVRKPQPLTAEGRAKASPTDPPDVLAFYPYRLKDWTPLNFK